MRGIVDETGRRWDVTLGKESYGTIVLLFAPHDGGAVRQAVLTAETPLQAEAELDTLDDDALRERLRGSVPWG